MTQHQHSDSHNYIYNEIIKESTFETFLYLFMSDMEKIFIEL